ncbi:hypothetical protein M2T82_00665 [Elizabethkingia ursingii]|uniref:hypothetical protein n=1 Tax=Elizabethkingia TaxID=308865 RepID=UPI000D324905|nr:MULTISPECIES: hypothetical protein [Elizabethkingia]MCL1666565.1 hypothetical protein [Elizabethkingia ursingii]PUB26337.1 hypothetical protein C8J95_11120 [Elizabethkingia sp. YR214]
MGYDLNFWIYKKGIYLNNQEVYKKGSNGEIIEGLEELPIEQIHQEIADEFREWEMEDSDRSWENPNGKGALIMESTSQFVRFDCYGMTGDDMNRIIDVMLKFGCPLYDPPTRYDQS